MPIPFTKDNIDKLFVPTVTLNVTEFINACSNLDSPPAIKSFIYSFNEDCFTKEFSREKVIALAVEKWELMYSKNIQEMYDLNKFIRGETHP